MSYAKSIFRNIQFRLKSIDDLLLKEYPLEDVPAQISLRNQFTRTFNYYKFLVKRIFSHFLSFVSNIVLLLSMFCI